MIIEVMVGLNNGRQSTRNSINLAIPTYHHIALLVLVILIPR